MVCGVHGTLLPLRPAIRDVGICGISALDGQRQSLGLIPSLRRGLMPTGPGMLAQRFRVYGIIRALRGRSLELQCTPSHKQVNVLFPQLLARDLVYEPTRGFPSRLQLHQPVVDLVSLSDKGKRRLASECERQLVPAPYCLRQREVWCL